MAPPYLLNNLIAKKSFNGYKSIKHKLISKRGLNQDRINAFRKLSEMFIPHKNSLCHLGSNPENTARCLNGSKISFTAPRWPGVSKN